MVMNVGNELKNITVPGPIFGVSPKMSAIKLCLFLIGNGAEWVARYCIVD